METIPLVDLTTPHRRILSDVLARIESVIRKSDFILGDAVADFEKAFASYCGTRHAAGVANGTEALHLALRALDLEPGAEVILPANTFVGTAFAASYVGAKPVLVDCVESTFLMDLDAVEDRITARTRVLIPVHLYGRMVDVDALLPLAERRELDVVEDAAQSHGAMIRGQRAGSVGAMGCFSFYPGKNLGAFGDGGAVVTSDDHLHARVQNLRNHGSMVKYQHTEVGYNCRLDTIQAAVLSQKLPELDQANLRRRERANRYAAMLDGVGDLVLPEVPDDGSHVFHLFVVRTRRREALLSHLHSRGVMAGVHYPKPVHLHEPYESLGYRPGSFPVAERLSREILSLPLYPELTDEDQDRVVREVRSFFSGPSLG